MTSPINKIAPATAPTAPAHGTGSENPMPDQRTRRLSRRAESKPAESAAARTLRAIGASLIQVRTTDHGSIELIAERPATPNEWYRIYSDGSYSTYVLDADDPAVGRLEIA